MAQMLEIIFGVPNYRYKVYLVRFIISMVLLFVILILMSWFTVFAILRIPVLGMVYQLMYPLLFLSCLSFLFSTLLRNASGTAVIMIVIGLFFMILDENLIYNKWNIFLNPFYTYSACNGNCVNHNFFCSFCTKPQTRHVYPGVLLWEDQVVFCHEVPLDRMYH